MTVNTPRDIQLRALAKGVLNLIEEAQPRFSSEFIPVYKLGTVVLAVRAVINAGVPVAVIPPKPIIRQHMANEKYPKYYNDEFRTITPDAIKRDEELFYRPKKWMTVLASGPCFFQYPQQCYVSDRSTASITEYLFNEGTRMVNLVKTAQSRRSQVDLPLVGQCSTHGISSPPQADDNDSISA